MPKLNVVAMVVLCLGVAGGAAVLALRAPASKIDAPRVDRLIRRLGDTDPDLRREAERELKDLGKKAEPALEEAARGSDPVIAERARTILGLKPATPPQEGARETVSVPAPELGVRLSLQIASPQRRRGEPLRYYLTLHNGTKRAIALARRLRDGDGMPMYAGFGAFESVDAEGRLVVHLDSDDDCEFPGGTTLDIVIVRPGESLDLAPGMGFLNIEAYGTFRVRFVYDATEGSEYRERVASGHHAGSALPAKRIESNEVSVTVY